MSKKYYILANFIAVPAITILLFTSLATDTNGFPGGIAQISGLIGVLVAVAVWLPINLLLKGLYTKEKKNRFKTLLTLMVLAQVLPFFYYHEDVTYELWKNYVANKTREDINIFNSAKTFEDCNDIYFSIRRQYCADKFLADSKDDCVGYAKFIFDSKGNNLSDDKIGWLGHYYYNPEKVECLGVSITIDKMNDLDSLKNYIENEREPLIRLEKSSDLFKSVHSSSFKNRLKELNCEGYHLEIDARGYVTGFSKPCESESVYQQKIRYR